MKKLVKLSLVLSCIFIFAGCGNSNGAKQVSERSSVSSEKVVKKKHKKKKIASSTESTTGVTDSTIQSVEQSSSVTTEVPKYSTPQEAPAPEQDPRIGQVVTSPHGHQSTVLRILPNGEMVISEQTSQADYNNDGVLTFEELSRAENELTQQAEQQRQAEQAQQPEVSGEVLITGTGSKYHSRECGNGTYSPISLESAQSMGLTPCEKCY